MNKFKLEIVTGTKELVKKEVALKIESVKFIDEKDDFLEIACNFENINQLRILKSVLRASNEFRTINLFRREWKAADSPAGINPSLSYLLNQVADVKSSDIIYDPFCGAGTISITGILDFNAKKAICSDISGKAVDWTLKNIKSAKLKKGRVAVFRSNISQVKLQKNSVDKVISNLPFGIRSKDHEQNVKSYRNLFSKAEVFLKQTGQMVLYTTEKDLIRLNTEKFNFQIKDELQIKQGGLYPSIFNIEKI